MKKRIVAFLLAVMLVSNVTGCGGSGTAAESSQEAAEETLESDNPLMNAEITVVDVFNGTGTNKLGERAYITISTEQFESLTPEQIHEFAMEKVEGSEYSWFSIMTDSGIGLQFVGSMTAVISYGTLDEDGRIKEDQGTWILRDGKYEFTSAEDY